MNLRNKRFFFDKNYWGKFGKKLVKLKFLGAFMPPRANGKKPECCTNDGPSKYGILDGE